jgi:hypothetical protein
LSTFSGDHKNANPIRIFTSKLIELEKLQHVENIVGTQQWNHVLWSQQKYPKNKFKFGDHVLWGSQKDRKHIGKFTKKWVGPYKVQLCP